MPRFAPTCPTQVYHGLKRDGEFGDYHLVLAHDVVKRPDDYSFLFGAPLSRDWTVILDNSVVELGNAVDMGMILEAVSIVKPTTTVLPDVMLKADATIKSCLDALDTWSDAFVKAGQKPQFLMLPQGTTCEDWVSCAEAFEYQPQINFWGVPRNVVAQDAIATRLGLPQILKAINPERKIHMFGFSDNVYDDVVSTRMNASIIEGIDSAVPTRAVSCQFAMSMASLSDMPRRGDWWESCEYHPDMAEYVKIARRWFA